MHQIGQDLLFFRLVEHLVIEFRIKVQRLVRGPGPPQKLLAGFHRRYAIGRAMQDQQRCADLLELRPVRCCRRAGFPPRSARENGREKRADRRGTAHDRRVARDIPAAHANQSQPREKHASQPGQVAKPGKEPPANLQGRPAEDQPTGLALGSECSIRRRSIRPGCAPTRTRAFLPPAGRRGRRKRRDRRGTRRTNESSIAGRPTCRVREGPSPRPHSRGGPGLGRRRVAAAMLDKAVDQQHFGPRPPSGCQRRWKSRRPSRAGKESSSKAECSCETSQQNHAALTPCPSPPQ